MPRFYYGFKLFGALVARGLRGVQLVISDAHTGLRKGIRGVLNGVAWQRCTVHFMRNVLCRVPKAARTLQRRRCRAFSHRGRRSREGGPTQSRGNPAW